MFQQFIFYTLMDICYVTAKNKDLQRTRKFSLARRLKGPQSCQAHTDWFIVASVCHACHVAHSVRRQRITLCCRYFNEDVKLLQCSGCLFLLLIKEGFFQTRKFFLIKIFALDKDRCISKLLLFNHRACRVTNSLLITHNFKVWKKQQEFLKNINFQMQLSFLIEEDQGKWNNKIQKSSTSVLGLNFS